MSLRPPCWTAIIGLSGSFWSTATTECVPRDSSCSTITSVWPAWSTSRNENQGLPTVVAFSAYETPGSTRIVRRPRPLIELVPQVAPESVLVNTGTLVPSTSALAAAVSVWPVASLGSTATVVVLADRLETWTLLPTPPARPSRRMAGAFAAACAARFGSSGWDRRRESAAVWTVFEPNRTGPLTVSRPAAGTLTPAAAAGAGASITRPITAARTSPGPLP